METAYRKSTLKVLRKIQPAKADDIRSAVRKFADDPTVPNNNLKPLKGVTNGTRIGIGDWRVSMRIDDAGENLEVFEIAPRGSAYAKGQQKARRKKAGKEESRRPEMTVTTPAFRPLGVTQIPKLEADVRDHLATAPDDAWALLFARALASLRHHLAAAEAAEDAAASAAFKASRGDELVPAEVVDQLLDGVNPLRVWRKHRGLTLKGLSEKADLSVSYLSEMERGLKEGSVSTLLALSETLGVDMDDLV